MLSQEDLYHTLSLGLYHRYKHEFVNTKDGKRKVIPKAENPYTFELFAANIMENILGGRAKVTKGSGEYGVDIFHTLPNRELYLAQIKSYDPKIKINHEPISILHSNMVHEKAHGAYFITTSSFSENATSRAKELNIHLINGYDFAQYCLGHKGSWLQEQEKISLWHYILNGWDNFYDELRNYINKRKRA